MRGIKLRSADMTPEDSRLLTATPKAVLYAMVKHLAAASDGDSYEGSLESGSYIARILNEWEAIHYAGIVKQKPIKLARIKA